MQSQNRFVYKRRFFSLTIQALSTWFCRRKYKLFFNGQICDWRELFYPKFIIGGDSFAAGMYEMTYQEKWALVSCHRVVNWWINLRGKKIQSSEELFLRSKIIIRCVRLQFRRIQEKDKLLQLILMDCGVKVVNKCVLLSPSCLLKTEDLLKILDHAKCKY